MERNDERNDRMLDSNDLTDSSRSAASGDAPLIGNEHPRHRDGTLDDARLATDRHLDDNPADEIGEAVGGISGVLTGAALGSLGGPIGTIIGGIAGAVAGWWAGKAISEAATHVTRADEDYYRASYESSPDRLADRSYEDVRPAYQLGHLAGRNPEYEGRSFEEVETDLQRGWTSDVSARHGDWQQVRPYARDAFERGRSGFGTGAVAGSGASAGAATASASEGRAHLTAAEQRDAGSMSRVGSTGGTSGTGASSAASGGFAKRDENLDDSLRATSGGSGAAVPDVSDRMGYGSAGAASSSAAAAPLDRAAGGVARGAHEVADRVDDLKDRIDGNPASRPGPDATDRPGYGAGATGLGSTGSAGTWESSADRPGIGDDVQRAGNRVENATENAWDATKRGAEHVGDEAENLWDRTKQGARNLADKVEDKADDAKDRVDGNPASRPGPDPTDRRV